MGEFTGPEPRPNESHLEFNVAAPGCGGLLVDEGLRGAKMLDRGRAAMSPRVELRKAGPAAHEQRMMIFILKGDCAVEVLAAPSRQGELEGNAFFDSVF